ncbi:similar to Saccharomyces cerevisiae YGR162W TIF4631 Translation initiation factor eIF4G, subunit of the mRNA cap-binding protein complex (eIF4F) that also contains eIF4E (Cdc33p) [Maudiozyma saulgeensis]|uniref:Similar to Saccharomyces cerevisiae YGR162W TIF4631 Translation initiation factor eIF4G, subunit of the mRNA cap-binding protein complex (eIF4F) that also contains eIF4E (Cdc33p) n=1 Tax=Maudiozyma saulgeensis TaxID=1789683 RepID=A0A1X7R3X5_9SACH|nr:similar to Saccharomyces cerevisiae YGR162W TIF4631 Translation initiation factor eIF4G, subunit of the mRNA cap-binding protein complex (eIF4F) that also contains eIF4E (Cdc33p) [Kazachstania saulgeensis]
MSDNEQPQTEVTNRPETKENKVNDNLSPQTSNTSSSPQDKESKKVYTKPIYNKTERSNNYNNRYNNGSNYNNNRNSYNGNSSGYNNNRASQQKGNRYINSNGSFYNNGVNGYNRNSVSYNQQNGTVPSANMGWNNYYMQPMYYVPQQMAMMNGVMYMDPNQYVPQDQNQSRRELMNKDTSPSSDVSTDSIENEKDKKEKPRTKIEITTKTGELLNLKKIHEGNAHQDDDSHKNKLDRENEAHTFPNSVEGSPDESDEKETVKEKETEAERNKKMFLEQVRLRKLALDAKNMPPRSTTTENKAETFLKTEIKNAIKSADEIEKAVEIDEKSLAEGEEEHNFEISKNLHEEQPPTTDKHVQIETPSPGSDVEQNELDEEVEVTKEKTDATGLSNEDISLGVDDDSERLSMSQMLQRLKEVPAIEDIYQFAYPEPFTASESQYKKEHIKYTYGPLFLLQFKDKIRVKVDPEWISSTRSKIVIPVSNNNRFKGRDNSRRNPSGRNADDRMTSSRDSSRRQSKRFDDRRSNRTTYTSRRDRERAAMINNRDAHQQPEKPKEDVAPLVPTANRWVPKSRQKKTEKKFAPDGVTELLTPDEVVSRMKSLLNKLTLEKFDTISADILAIGNLSKWESDGTTLQNVITQIFNKATDEPYWSSMYAQLCGKLVKELDEGIIDENQEGKSGPKLILHYLVDICHTEFEKGWIDKLPTNEDGSPLAPEMMSDEYYEMATAKRRGLGLVRFIGFLYRLNLLSGKMMFECFRRLMKDLTDNPSEEVLESVIELLSTVGEQFEDDSFNVGKGTLEGSVLLDSLFGLMSNIINEDKVSSRIKFKMIDIKELRENKNWNSEKKNAGPKTIQEIHREEEIARQLKNSRGPPQRRSTGGSYHNNNNYSRQHQYGSTSRRRDAPRDSFTSTRTTSTRYSKGGNVPKEEPKSQPAQTNRFSALMHDNDDD